MYVGGNMTLNDLIEKTRADRGLDNGLCSKFSEWKVCLIIWC